MHRCKMKPLCVKCFTQLNHDKKNHTCFYYDYPDKNSYQS